MGRRPCNWLCLPRAGDEAEAVTSRITSESGGRVCSPITNMLGGASNFLEIQRRHLRRIEEVLVKQLTVKLMSFETLVIE